MMGSVPSWEEAPGSSLLLSLRPVRMQRDHLQSSTRASPGPGLRHLGLGLGETKACCWGAQPVVLWNGTRLNRTALYWGSDVSKHQRGVGLGSRSAHSPPSSVGCGPPGTFSLWTQGHARPLLTL